MDGNMKQDASTHRAIKDIEANNQSEECEDNNVRENWNFKNVSRTQIFTFISTASLHFSSMICFSILGPFFPPEAQKKGVSTTVIGLIFGCFALSHFLSSLILGKYLVKIGPKFMFVAGMFVSGCATILFGLLDKAPDGAIFIALCFVVRSVDAIGFSASRTASFPILAEAFPKNLATALGWLELFTGLGLILGPPIGGFLNQAYGYEIPFIIVGSIVLLMVPINFGILPKYDTIPGTGSIRTLLTIPKNLLLCLSLFSLSSCVGFLDPSMSLFLKEKFHLKVSAIGLVFLGIALAYSISTPILGILSDRFPKLRSYFIIAGNLLIALCFFMFGPVPFLHIDSKLWLFVLMLIINGFSKGLSLIPVFPEMVRGAYENGYEEGLSTLGLISGLFSAMWSIGYFVGPTLGGFLNEKFHFEWASAMQGLLPLMTGILLAAYSIWEACKKKSSPSEQEVSSKPEDSKNLFKE